MDLRNRRQARGTGHIEQLRLGQVGRESGREALGMGRRGEDQAGESNTGGGTQVLRRIRRLQGQKADFMGKRLLGTNAWCWRSVGGIRTGIGGGVAGELGQGPRRQRRSRASGTWSGWRQTADESLQLLDAGLQLVDVSSRRVSVCGARGRQRGSTDLFSEPALSSHGTRAFWQLEQAGSRPSHLTLRCLHLTQATGFLGCGDSDGMGAMEGGAAAAAFCCARPRPEADRAHPACRSCALPEASISTDSSTNRASVAPAMSSSGAASSPLPKLRAYYGHGAAHSPPTTSRLQQELCRPRRHSTSLPMQLRRLLPPCCRRLACRETKPP